MTYRISIWTFNYHDLIRKIAFTLLILWMIPSSTSVQSVENPVLLKKITVNGELIGVSPDGAQILLFSDENNTISISDSSGQLLHVLPAHEKPTELKFIDNDLIRAYYSNRAEYSFDLFDLRNEHLLSSQVNGFMGVESHSGYFYVAQDQKTYLYDTETRQELFVFDGEGRMFSSDGQMLAVTNREEGKTIIYSIVTGEALLQHKGSFGSFSPDGNFVTFIFPINTEGASQVDLVELANGEIVAEYSGNYSEFSPDSTLLLVSGNPGTKIINLSNKEIVVESRYLMTPTPHWQILIERQHSGGMRVINFDSQVASDWFPGYWSMALTNDMLITYDSGKSYLVSLPSGEMFAEMEGRVLALSPNQRYLILSEKGGNRDYLISVDSEDHIMEGEKILFSQENDLVFIFGNMTLSIYQMATE